MQTLHCAKHAGSQLKNRTAEIVCYRLSHSVVTLDIMCSHTAHMFQYYTAQYFKNGSHVCSVLTAATGLVGRHLQPAYPHLPTTPIQGLHSAAQMGKLRLKP